MVEGDGLHGFECISIPMDPGASESALPKFQCMDMPLRQTDKSRSGYTYEAAGGQSILNEGERNLIFMAQEGNSCNMAFQVAEVNKGLRSVADLVDIGHKVVFDANGSYMQDPSSQRAHLRRQRGMWYLDCWKVPREYFDNPADLAKVF